MLSRSTSTRRGVHPCPTHSPRSARRCAGCSIASRRSTRKFGSAPSSAGSTRARCGTSAPPAPRSTRKFDASGASAAEATHPREERDDGRRDVGRRVRFPMKPEARPHPRGLGPPIKESTFRWPRSIHLRHAPVGTTLLDGILQQNPAFHAAMSGPVAPMVQALLA